MPPVYQSGVGLPLIHISVIWHRYFCFYCNIIYVQSFHQALLYRTVWRIWSQPRTWNYLWISESPRRQRWALLGFRLPFRAEQWMLIRWLSVRRQAALGDEHAVRKVWHAGGGVPGQVVLSPALTQASGYTSSLYRLTTSEGWKKKKKTSVVSLAMGIKRFDTEIDVALWFLTFKSLHGCILQSSNYLDYSVNLQ